MTAEQSNSSVVYGDTFILKLLRRIVPGINPDLELPLALAREGCPRVPAPAGWMVADLAGRSWVLGVLQPYVQGATDGWELALRELAKGEDFTAEARALGRATAEVHTALARALPTVTLGHGQLRQLADGMIERLDEAAHAVPPPAPAVRARAAHRVHGAGRPGRRGPHLDRPARPRRPAPRPVPALALRPVVADRLRGEPAKPLAERRMPQPPVRDIAGMLRSFDYAAHSADASVPGWADSCRAAYCTGYAEVAGSDPRTDPVMLRAHETDKAVYEVLYEARHRPDWLAVPLSAVRRLSTPEPA